ncbi:MAG: hypothetical protein IKB70_01910 [Bacilli bacterium]|nr:hypothetical protein [Bacilli bacterium]
MKKILPTIGLGLACLGLVLSQTPAQFTRVDAAMPQLGELNNGARVTFGSSTEDSIDYITVNWQDTVNNGIDMYVRIRNYSSVDANMYLLLEGTSGHTAVMKAGGSYQLHDVKGETFTSYKASEEQYFTLPAKFDGYFWINALSVASLDSWSLTSDIKNISSISFGINTKLQGGVKLGIGDIITKTAMNLDVSSLTNDDFLKTFVAKDSSEKVTIERLPDTDFDTNHDILGGALVTVTYQSEDKMCTFLVLPKEKDLSGSGIYFRIKNAWEYGFYIQFHVLDANGHRMAVKPSSPYYEYDLTGKTKTEVLTRDFGSFFYIKGSYDAFIYIPYETLIDDSTWATNVDYPTMDYTNVYALIFGISAFHDRDTKTIFGDIFTDSVTVFDGSEVTLEETSSFFLPDQYGFGEFINISRVNGYKNEKTYEYTSINNFDETHIEGGANFSLSKTPNDIDVSFTINKKLDFTDMNAIAIHINNYTYDYPIAFKIKDENGKEGAIIGPALGNVYYLDTAGNRFVNGWGGNTRYAKIPVNFEGLMIIPFTLLSGSVTFNKAKVVSIEIAVNGFYDYDFNTAFGEIGGIDDNYNYVSLFSPLELEDSEWEEIYTLSLNAEYGELTRVESPKYCPWIGDVKILNSCIYETDEEMYKETLTDDADNPLTYERNEEGVVITPSDYEVGHANGPYSCLVFVNNANFADRLVMTDSNGQEAKGVTIYVKNLSSREIGISIGFDQLLSSGAVQRWTLIGYPSMYYAYDVNEDAHYSYYFKRDQFQIPVGFEGYIRLPFESYGVPDWCKTNEELNVHQFTGNFYVTQDNRSFAGLSYLIKNLGFYFNETSTGSLFSNENTIKSNMGL